MSFGKTSGVLAGALFVCCNLFPLKGFSQTITLQQAIEIALKNNLQIKRSLLDKENFDIDLYKAKQSALPNLNYNNSGNVYVGRGLDPTTNLYLDRTSIASTINIASNFTVFQGFQKVNQIRANKLLVEGSKNQVEKIKDDIRLQVITAYLAILDYQDQVSTASRQRDFSKLQLDYETQNFSIGRRTMADISRAKYQLLKNETDVTTAQNQLAATLVVLSQLMNLAPGTPLNLAEVPESEILQRNDSVTAIYNHALGLMPEIKYAEFNRLAAFKQLEIARGTYLPSLTLSTGIYSSYSYQFHYVPSIFSVILTQPTFFSQIRSNAYGYLGLNLTIPIFNNSSAKIAVAKAKVNFETAQVDEQIARDNLYKIILQSLADLRTAESIYNSAKQALEATRKTFEIIKDRYETKLSNSLDFSQAQNDMNQAEFTLIHAKYELIFKRKILDFYEGAPISF